MAISHAPEGRIACVDLPALPLQLLLKQRPSWRQLPVAVIADDRPTAALLWVNAAARAAGVWPGMRFAAARGLAPRLRADIVPPETLEAAVGELFAALHSFSPRVEVDETPGVFFLDPGGLARLYGSLEQWSVAVGASLRHRGFTAAVVVGFQRFRCHAIARAATVAPDTPNSADIADTAGRPGAGSSCWVIPSAAREARMAAGVALAHLELSPRLRDALATLEVRTLGELLALPRAELRERFGEEAARIHARAGEGRWDPLRPRELTDPIARELHFDDPELDHHRLLFRIKRPLEALVGQLAARGQGMSALHLCLGLDHHPPHHERLEPAAPTLDVAQVLELLRLRLDGQRLPAGVVSAQLALEGSAIRPEQITLFQTRARRDLEAGARALARLRAAYGPAAVTRARVVPAHLPEARYLWEPVSDLHFPAPTPMRCSAGLVDAPALPLTHRFLRRPLPLPPLDRHAPGRWPQIDPRHGPVVQLHGPWRVSGGWWVRTVERDYFYAETRRGDLLWVFFDRVRRRWLLQGEID